MHRKNNIAVAILATSIIGLAAGSASAVNNNFAENAASIVMGFQGVNGLNNTNVVELTLGDSTVYRDATANIPNIINIGSLLDANFDPDGAGPLRWYDTQDLFMGLGTVWNNANPPSSLRNGDPEQTVYLSKARNSVGSQGLANSTIAVPTGGNLGSASNSLLSLQGRVETSGTLAAQAYLRSLTNTWEDQNPTSGAYVQTTAYGFVTGGTQFQFGLGNFAYSNGTQEGALDLYRMQRVDDIATQYGFGAGSADLGNQTPEFQGIFTIDQSGNVSFIAPVPEPSSALLFGGASVLGLALRRRRTTVAA